MLLVEMTSWDGPLVFLLFLLIHMNDFRDCFHVFDLGAGDGRERDTNLAYGMGCVNREAFQCAADSRSPAVQQNWLNISISWESQNRSNRATTSHQVNRSRWW